VVNAAPEFSYYLQRREHLASESRGARAVYAYGVDLRRAAWLDHSSVGEPMMRAVDRRWSTLLQSLTVEALQPEDQSPPTVVMQRLYRLIDTLRSPRPAVRLLRADADPRAWPIVTPLGTTHGGAHLLILDIDRLEALTAAETTFVLASALSHLQCDHGPLLTAHLVAHRTRHPEWLVRRALAPWAKVAVFSADRAALLVSGNFEETAEALATQGTPEAPWWPTLPPLRVRLDALEDFDKSRVMARVRMAQESRDAEPRPASAQADGNEEAPATGAPLDDPEDPVAAAEREAEKILRQQEGAEASEDREAEQRAESDRVRNAWPLARCDQRLTRKLGLL